MEEIIKLSMKNIRAKEERIGLQIKQPWGWLVEKEFTQEIMTQTIEHIDGRRKYYFARIWYYVFVLCPSTTFTKSLHKKLGIY